ncbi:uncharacterized protein ATC70_013135 [Mucor velutinosus]|uniref:Uncharacterized protein n=1 Tax=Mucor velutinosus TaxID=708070 RepID=A0AAN7DTB2_9FUNG|nr:hypothetical protein ATC70_013135 [Mucor velutinosus]
MSKVTILIDSDDDDDVVEILEYAPSIKPSLPVKKVSREAVLSQDNQQRVSKRPPPTLKKLPNVTNTKPAPKHQPPSSSKAQAITSCSLKDLASKKQSLPPSPEVKTLPKSILPSKPTASSPRPAPPPPPPLSPSKAKVHSKPKTPAPAPASPKRPGTSKIHHNNLPNAIPAPVVIYSPETRPSENSVPLNSINKLFQRDARTVTLTKAAKRPCSGLSKSPSAIDISKKCETDKELAAIFASSSPEPTSSTSAPSSTSTTPTSSQTMRSSPAAMEKRHVVSSSPPRKMHGGSRCSQEPRQSSLFSPNSLNSPPAPTLKRPISSPQNSSLFSRPAFIKKKVIYGIDDEDGEEEDLELYINHVSSRRKLFSDELKEAERREMGNKQCPLCYMMFPKQEIMDHSFECDGKPTDKGLKKRTIGTAIALNAAERKRKNAGVLDTGPTNYYADSDGALALDGSGFGSEVTGLSWESAGQTRFA